LRLVSDITYMLIDPRIDFREPVRRELARKQRCRSNGAPCPALDAADRRARQFRANRRGFLVALAVPRESRHQPLRRSSAMTADPIRYDGAF